MNLNDRVCVITGATGGLGSVVTRRFAELGASLALISTGAEKLRSLSASLNLSGGACWFGAYDLRSHRAAQEAAAQVQQRFGRVDILVHAVGGWTGGKPLLEAPALDFSAMLDQHLWTTFHTAQAFVPLMVSAGWGRFIAISSPAASDPGPKSAPYAAGKAAMEAMLRSHAQDLAGSGVTANVIQVNTIDTEHKRERSPSPSNAGWTTPEEITAAILYLCTPEGGRLNGVRLPLFG